MKRGVEDRSSELAEWLREMYGGLGVWEFFVGDGVLWGDALLRGGA